MNIGVSAGVNKAYLMNFNTVCKVDDANLSRITTECWELRQPYYREGCFRVPVPVTMNGKHVFMTGIVKIGQSPMASEEYDGVRQAIAYDWAHEKAKFAEVIVHSKEVLTEDGKKTKDADYEIVAFRGLPCKDVPPSLLEIAANLSSKPELYKYEPKDLTQAMIFWTQHIIVRRS